MRKILNRWAAELARDSGVAGLIIAMIIAVVAATALMVLFKTAYGPARDVARIQATNESQERLLTSMFASYFTQATAPRRIPCPDTDFDGVAETSCGSSGTATGTLPWKTLGVSRNDARDGYGRYYTYVVAAADATREMCVSVGNDYDTDADPEYTGALVESDVLEVRTTSQTAGEGRYVPFAIISHGANGLGAKVSTGVTLSMSGAGDSELTNATSNTSAVITGPFVGGDSGFDDVVIAPTNSALLKACTQLTPAEVANGQLSDDFQNNTGALDGDKWDTTLANNPSITTGSDPAARFTDATTYLATAGGYNFMPSARPVYVSAYWTPSDVAGQFSIVTRATPPPDSGDDFDIGVTFRFSASGIAIREDGANLNTPAAFTIVAGEEYHLEVYDNGNDVWARITRVDNPATTATASDTTTADLTDDQRVVFINGATQSDLDDVLIGVPMLAAEFNGASSIISSSTGNTLGTSASLTVEAWIYPNAYPTTGNASVIAATWDTTDESTPANLAYRFYLNGGEVHLRLAGEDGAGTGIVRTYDAGFSPDLHDWTHVAATFDETDGSVRFYKNGDLMRTLSGEIDGGISDTGDQLFTVGAERNNGTAGDFFDGRISDVRVWNVVRSPNEVRTTYNTRVAANTTGLVVNWRLDPTPSQGGLFAGTTVVAATGSDGTSPTSVTYGATLSRYFRPISTDFCPTPDENGDGGTRVGPYQCDFRVASTATTATVWQIDLPDTMQTIYAKLWGAGGGGYVGAGTRQGGDGGYTAGLIEKINNADISGANLYLMSGAGGRFSSTTSQGAGGGAGSILQDMAGHVSLVAGGGGGASYSDNGVCSDEVNCGDGGGGGGANSTMTRAFDDGTNCGGRGGTLSGFGPPVAVTCPDGGADNSASSQGSGGTLGALGGGGLVVSGGSDVSGGRGYAASEGSGGTVGNSVGGGGGGGGAAGGEAGGFENGAARAAFGGGGGSGLAAAGVSNATGASSSHSTDFSYNGGCELDITNNSNVATLRLSSCGTLNPQTLGWTQGMAVAGTDVPAGSYFGAVTTTTVTFVSSTGTAQNAQNGGFSGPVTVTQAAGSDAVGGGTDSDYHPTYAASYPEPGLGGTGGVSGNPGAIVLKW